MKGEDIILVVLFVLILVGTDGRRRLAGAIKEQEGY